MKHTSPPSWDEIILAGPGRRRDYDYDHIIKEFARRSEFIGRFSFAIPSPQAVAAIAEHIQDRKLLELGAGTGLWASLLSAIGVPVAAVDNHSWNGNVPIQHGLWYPVEHSDAKAAVTKYADHTAIFFCWPDYDKPWAAEALRHFQGDRLVYIGEGDGGCTGDAEFHAQRYHWREKEVIDIPQWPGIHDAVHLYER